MADSLRTQPARRRGPGQLHVAARHKRRLERAGGARRRGLTVGPLAAQGRTVEGEGLGRHARIGQLLGDEVDDALAGQVVDGHLVGRGRARQGRGLGLGRHIVVDHRAQGVELTGVHEAGAQGRIAQAGGLHRPGVRRIAAQPRAALVLIGPAHPDIVEQVVGEQGRPVADRAVGEVQKGHAQLDLLVRRRARLGGQVIGRLVGNQGALIAGDGEGDARGRDRRVAKGGGEQPAIAGPRGDGGGCIGRNIAGQGQGPCQFQLGLDLGPGALFVGHFRRVHQRGQHLVFQAAARGNHCLAGQGIIDLGSRPAVPELQLAPQSAEIGGRRTIADLRAEAKQVVASRQAMLVHMGHAGRAEGVVLGAELAVLARIAGRARVAAALAGTVAGSAGHGIVARQLFVPEQDLAQDALGLGDRVLARDRHGRQGRGGHARQGQDHKPYQHADRRPAPACCAHAMLTHKSHIKYCF